MNVQKGETMDGQMTIDEWLAPEEAPQEPKTWSTPDAAIRQQDDGQEAAAETEVIEYGYRGCAACIWRTKDERCRWAEHLDRPNKPKVEFTYPSCEGYGSFEPSEYMVPEMCASCKWANSFRYQKKPEYLEREKRTGQYCKEAFGDPVEEPNIYCTHPEGSLNRRTAYKDIEWPGFGACHWDRQHEWDTCDRWEVDHGPHIDYSKYFPDNGNRTRRQRNEQSISLQMDTDRRGASGG